MEEVGALLYGFTIVVGAVVQLDWPKPIPKYAGPDCPPPTAISISDRVKYSTSTLFLSSALLFAFVVEVNFTKGGAVLLTASSVGEVK